MLLSTTSMLSPSQGWTDTSPAAQFMSRLSISVSPAHLRYMNWPFSYSGLLSGDTTCSTLSGALSPKGKLGPKFRKEFSCASSAASSICSSISSASSSCSSANSSCQSSTTSPRASFMSLMASDTSSIAPSRSRPSSRPISLSPWRSSSPIPESQLVQLPVVGAWVSGWGGSWALSRSFSTWAAYWAICC